MIDYRLRNSKTYNYIKYYSRYKVTLRSRFTRNVAVQIGGITSQEIYWYIFQAMRIRELL